MSVKPGASWPPETGQEIGTALADWARKAGADTTDDPLPGSGLRLEQLTGGYSNRTFRVSDDTGAAWVLRMPPAAGVLATAHDMAREARLLAALKGWVPVPTLVAAVEDPEWMGCPFLLMSYVSGVSPRDADQLEAALPLDARKTASRSTVQVLAALHRIDPAVVGLADLGRPEGYVARQIDRWMRQIAATNLEVPSSLTALGERLRGLVPVQQRAAVVHGDFRLDNLILAPNGMVAAVVDWELATIGDPLVDMALLLLWWTEGDELNTLGVRSPSAAPGMLARDEVVELYRKESGLDLAHLPYYRAFAHWRTACISLGVLQREQLGGGEGHGELAESSMHQHLDLAMAMLPNLRNQ